MPDTQRLDLKTCDFFLGSVQVLAHPQGFKIDFYTICNEGEDQVVGLSVPHQRPDVASFVVRCLLAGQKLLSKLNSDEPFAPERAEPNLPSVIKGVFLREADADTILSIMKEFGVEIDPQHVRNRLAILRHKKAD